MSHPPKLNHPPRVYNTRAGPRRAMKAKRRLQPKLARFKDQRVRRSCAYAGCHEGPGDKPREFIARRPAHIYCSAKCRVSAFEVRNPRLRVTQLRKLREQAKLAGALGG